MEFSLAGDAAAAATAAAGFDARSMSDIGTCTSRSVEGLQHRKLQLCNSSANVSFLSFSFAVFGNRRRSQARLRPDRFVLIGKSFCFISRLFAIETN